MGRLRITACPLHVITDDVWETLQYADLYKRGIPPITGGALDQLAIFNAAARLIWAESARIEKEMIDGARGR